VKLRVLQSRAEVSLFSRPEVNLGYVRPGIEIFTQDLSTRWWPDVFGRVTWCARGRRELQRRAIARDTVRMSLLVNWALEERSPFMRCLGAAMQYRQAVVRASHWEYNEQSVISKAERLFLVYTGASFKA
jgi:hypothetical protein